MAASKDLLCLYAQWRIQYPQGTVEEFYDWLEILQDALDAEDTSRGGSLGGVL